MPVHISLSNLFELLKALWLMRSIAMWYIRQGLIVDLMGESRGAVETVGSLEGLCLFALSTLTNLGIMFMGSGRNPTYTSWVEWVSQCKAMWGKGWDKTSFTAETLLVEKDQPEPVALHIRAVLNPGTWNCITVFFSSWSTYHYPKGALLSAGLGARADESWCQVCVSTSDVGISVMDMPRGGRLEWEQEKQLKWKCEKGVTKKTFILCHLSLQPSPPAPHMFILTRWPAVFLALYIACLVSGLYPPRKASAGNLPPYPRQHAAQLFSIYEAYEVRSFLSTQWLQGELRGPSRIVQCLAGSRSPSHFLSIVKDLE